MLSPVTVAGAHMPLRSKIVSLGQVEQKERLIWRDLCSTDRALASPFYSVFFAEAAARAGVDASVCILEQENRVVGFFPFQFANGASRWMGAAERIGGELSDYCGLVAKTDLRLTERELLRLAGLSTFSFSHLDNSQTRHGLSGENPETGLIADMPDGANIYWQDVCSRDKALANDTKRRARRAVEQLGDLRFEFQSSTPHQVLDHLINSKRAQYARSNRKDALEEPWKRRLLHLIADYRENDFAGVVSTLHAGKTWLASHFGIRSRNVLHYWFPVYNPETDRFSPGRLLYKHIVDAADTNRISVIDRGAGDTNFKRDFSNVSHTFLRGRWQRRGFKSLTFAAAMSANWRFSAWRKR